MVFVAFLLVILFVGVVRTGIDGRARNIPFLALILLSAFQAFLSGLRWGLRYFRCDVCGAAIPS